MFQNFSFLPLFSSLLHADLSSSIRSPRLAGWCGKWFFSLSKILSFAETGKELREEGSSSDFFEGLGIGMSFELRADDFSLFPFDFASSSPPDQIQCQASQEGGGVRGDFVCREKEVWDYWVFVRDQALDSEIWGSVESSRAGILSLTLLQGISPLHRNKMHFYTRPILDRDSSSLTSYHMYKT